MNSALYPTYARADIAFSRGEGAWLIAEKGDRYREFAAGGAGLALDHLDLVACLGQVPGGGDAEQPGAKDDDFHGGEGCLSCSSVV